MRHGEKEEQSSQNMFLLYGVVQISPDFLNIMCHVSKNYFMNNLDYASAVKSRHCLTKECQEKRKGGGSCEGAVREEGAGLKHNARCGLVAGRKVIGQVFLPRETYTVHYTVKRKV